MRGSIRGKDGGTVGVMIGNMRVMRGSIRGKDAGTGGVVREVPGNSVGGKEGRTVGVFFPHSSGSSASRQHQREGRRNCGAFYVSIRGKEGGTVFFFLRQRRREGRTNCVFFFFLVLHCFGILREPLRDATPEVKERSSEEVNLEAVITSRSLRFKSQTSSK